MAPIFWSDRASALLRAARARWSAFMVFDVLPFDFVVVVAAVGAAAVAVVGAAARSSSRSGRVQFSSLRCGRGSRGRSSSGRRRRSST